MFLIFRGDCVDGVRRICSEKMETVCGTEMVKHRMEEDRPSCRVHLVDSCKPRKKKKKAFFAFLKIRNEEEDEDEMHCEKVRAVRCKVEKKMVTKTKPETKCRRVPREFCRKEECGDYSDTNEKLDDGCYFRTQMVRLIS